jgi:hypothetical protein
MTDYSVPHEQAAVAELDTVVLIDGLPSLGIEPGTTGAVVAVHSSPSAAVEVEVVYSAGRTRFCGAVEFRAIRLLHSAGADENGGVTDDCSG